MNSRRALDLLRALDDPNAPDATARDVGQDAAEARRRADASPEPDRLELGRHLTPDSARRHRWPAGVVAAVLLVAATLTVTLVVVDQQRRATPAPRTDTSAAASPGGPSAVETVTSPGRVFEDQRDTLAPLVPSDLATLDVVQAIAVVRAQDARAAQFLNDPDALTVRLGLYTNRGLRGADGKPTVDVPAFVITGGQATCVWTGKYVPGATNSTSPCTATLVVDARTGALLAIEERSHT